MYLVVIVSFASKEIFFNYYLFRPSGLKALFSSLIYSFNIEFIYVCSQVVFSVRTLLLSLLPFETGLIYLADSLYKWDHVTTILQLSFDIANYLEVFFRYFSLTLDIYNIFSNIKLTYQSHILMEIATEKKTCYLNQSKIIFDCFPWRIFYYLRERWLLSCLLLEQKRKSVEEYRGV